MSDEHPVACRNRVGGIAGRGKTVWLRVPPEVLHVRILGDPLTLQRRPNLTSVGGVEEIRRLLTEREPVYEACADQIVDAEALSPLEIARLIHPQPPSQEQA